MVQQEEFRPSSDAFCHLASGNSVNSAWIKQKKQHKKNLVCFRFSSSHLFVLSLRRSEHTAD